MSGWVAQLAEQRTENPRVGSSILPPATIPFSMRVPGRFAKVIIRPWKFTLFANVPLSQTSLVSASITVPRLSMVGKLTVLIYFLPGIARLTIHKAGNIDAQLPKKKRAKP
jgi:hypothetical protein